eukprot:4952171-Amphidinium_carterae.1
MAPHAWMHDRATSGFDDQNDVMWNCALSQSSPFRGGRGAARLFHGPVCRPLEKAASQQPVSACVAGAPAPSLLC